MIMIENVSKSGPPHHRFKITPSVSVLVQRGNLQPHLHNVSSKMAMEMLPAANTPNRLEFRPMTIARAVLEDAALVTTLLQVMPLGTLKVQMLRIFTKTRYNKLR